jgi:hypothetical protein
MPRIATIVTLFALALPGLAQAATRGHRVAPAGQLPFGGSDLVLLAAGVIAMIVAGAVARHLTKLADPARRASAAGFGAERQPPARVPQPAGSR